MEFRAGCNGEFYFANSMRQTFYSSISSQQKTYCGINKELKDKDQIIQDQENKIIELGDKQVYHEKRIASLEGSSITNQINPQ